MDYGYIPTANIYKMEQILRIVEGNEEIPNIMKFGTVVGYKYVWTGK